MNVVESDIYIHVYDLKTRKDYDKVSFLFDDPKAAEAIEKELTFVRPDELQWGVTEGGLIIIDSCGNWMYPPQHLDLDFYITGVGYEVDI